MKFVVIFGYDSVITFGYELLVSYSEFLSLLQVFFYKLLRD